MTKTMKKTTVFAAFAAAALLAAGIGFANPVNASAQMVEGDVATSGFTMTDGASLKSATGGVGIRWQTTVTEEFKTYLTQTYGEGATVAYKTLVTGVNMLPADGDITDVTPDLKKADGETAACAILDGALQADGTYDGRIIYGAEDTAAWETIKDAAVRAELIARAYVEVTPATGDPVIIYAQANDTTRAMQGVAVHALDWGSTTDKEIAKEYVTSLSNLKAQQKQIPYYNYLDGANTMEVAGLADGTYNAYAYAAKAGTVTVENGVVSGLDRVTVEKGKTEHPLRFVNENDEGFLVSFINPTAILTKADDFKMFEATTSSINSTGATTYTKYDGYYLLANDIDWIALTDTTEKQFEGFYGRETNAHANSGLTGVFDGRGHTIKGVRAPAGGLFGMIGKTGVVKNVAMLHAVLSTEDWRGGGVLAYCIFEGATLENVYIEQEGWDNGSTSNQGLLAYSVNEKANIKNVVVKTTITQINNAHNAFAHRPAIVTGTTTGQLNETNWSNFFFLTPQDLGSAFKITAENETLDTSKYGMKGCYKYTSEAAMTEAYNAEGSAIKEKVDSFSSTFWTIKDGVPTWGADTSAEADS